MKLLNKSNPQKIIFIYETEGQNVHSIDNIIIKEENKNEDNFELNNDNYDNLDVSFDDKSNDIITNDSLSFKKKSKLKRKSIKLKTKDRKFKDKGKGDDDNDKNSNSNHKNNKSEGKVVKRLILMDVSKWKKFDLTEEDAVQVKNNFI